MLKTVSGVYKDGKIIFDDTIDMPGDQHVLVTFLSDDKDEMVWFTDTNGVKAEILKDALHQHIKNHGKAA